MGTGWRRAFCTSIRRDAEAGSPVEPQSSPSPRSCTRLRFFGKSSSTPSTPRLQLQQQQQPQPPPSLPSTPTLRCRTKSAAGTGAVSADVLGDSPKLQCKTSVAVPAKAEAAAPGSCGRSPRLPFVSPNPPSPRSPSRFALLRNNLRISRSSCGICLQSVKAKQGTAIFTAECSHVFHFHCIAAGVRKQGALVCPVCRAAWRQVPLLSDISAHRHPRDPALAVEEAAELENPKRKPSAEPKQGKLAGAGDDGLCNNNVGRVYNDDEPLMSPAACRPAGRFNPIPESEEQQQGEDEEFRGFFSVDPSPVSSPRCAAGRRHQLGGVVQVVVLPTVALLSAGRSHENYVVAVKVKAPSSSMPRPAAAAGAEGSGTAPPPLLEPSRRAPIDLVTVLDVGGNMTSAKLHMMKRAMRLVVASLGPADRLSIVAFSSSSKRLLPLRRMSPEGQRAARRIVDRLLCGDGSCAGEALKKAVKVLEDRRERNHVASVMLLSDAPQQQQHGDPHHAASPRNAGGGLRGPTTHSDVPFSPNTRFAHLEIPVQTSGIGAGHRREDAEDVFARCVGGLLSVVLQDARLELTFPSGEVCSVYALGGGGGADPLRLGDMYADEERELLVELRVPCPRRGGGGHDQDHQLLPLVVRCSYRDPSTQVLVHGREQRLLVPVTRHHSPAAAAPKVDRLRNLFVTTRSITEARRLADHGDFATGIHLLSSARRLLLQSNSIHVEEDLRTMEAELEALHCRRQQMRRSEAPETPTFSALDDGAGVDALTPTSAWRAAERLAKVAIMRKSMNRVSDLHGFENARF